VPSWKMAVRTDSPWIDCERRTSRRGTPPTAVSSGRVTSCSTSAGDSPGASVWTTTCGGVNSGKTSSRAWPLAYRPAPRSRTARAMTTTQLRIDHSTRAWSMSVVVHVAPELLGEQDLGLAVDYGLPRRHAGGQHPAAV